MFSLKNKDSLPPFKSLVLKADKATCDSDVYGAVFGNGAISSGVDLFISGHPPTDLCYSNLGNSYKLPRGYVKSSDEARCLLAGSSKFTPSEIEVFCHKQD
jgi:hypothetical protein